MEQMLYFVLEERQLYKIELFLGRMNIVNDLQIDLLQDNIKFVQDLLLDLVEDIFADLDHYRWQII